MKKLKRKISRLPNKHSPASLTEISKAEKSLETTLPKDYKKFMQLTNGYEGKIGNNYVQLWQIEKLKKLNSGYSVDEFAPDLLVIGSSGGGEGYAYDKSNNFTIVKVPFSDLGTKQRIKCGKNFTDFLENL